MNCWVIKMTMNVSAKVSSNRRSVPGSFWLGFWKSFNVTYCQE